MKAVFASLAKVNLLSCGKKRCTGNRLSSRIPSWTEVGASRDVLYGGLHVYILIIHHM